MKRDPKLTDLLILIFLTALNTISAIALTIAAIKLLENLP